jgi:LysR family transcriptional regulator, low CO2-responsive transcriptional regulator
VVAGRPPDDLPSARVRAVSPNTLVVVGPPDAGARFDPARATWLLREPASGMRATCAALFERLDISPPQMTLGSNGAVIAAAVAGLGVTLVSRQAVRRHVDAGVLVELPVPEVPLDRPWHVVSQPDPTPSTRLLIEHVLAVPELGWREPDSR